MAGETVGKGLKAGAIPVKVVGVKKAPIKRGKYMGRLIASMDLDEMLEASRIVDMGFRGEKIPFVKSPKVQKYVGTVLQLNKRTSTKSVAKKIQQDLTVQIVERNRKTTNPAKAKSLYHALMEEE